MVSLITRKNVRGSRKTLFHIPDIGLFPPKFETLQENNLSKLIQDNQIILHISLLSSALHQLHVRDFKIANNVFADCRFKVSHKKAAVFYMLYNLSLGLIFL